MKGAAMTTLTRLKRIVAAAAVVIAGTAVAKDSSAATRTVCYRVQVRDERNDCPTPGTAGVKRACDPTSNYSDAVGMEISVWDRDTIGDPQSDEYIGSWTISDTGVRCVTFEWENASYAQGVHAEANPDVYITVAPRVRSTSAGSTIVRAVDAAGTLYGSISNRGTPITDCTAAGSCTFATPIQTGSNPADDVSQAFMMLDTAQRVLQAYSGDLDNTTVNAWYPVVNASDPNSTSCATGLAWTRTDFCLAAGDGADGGRVAHEAGHCAHMMAFEQDSLNSVLVGGSWNMGNTDNETESGAMTEGFASYVGAVAWYNPNAGPATPQVFGTNIETYTDPGTLPLCANYRLRPVNVAKAFWDWDDSANEVGTLFSDASDDDLCNRSTSDSFNTWDSFVDGTANRQDREGGNNGVNAWDFWDYADSFGGSCDPEVTFVNHNCLQGSAI